MNPTEKNDTRSSALCDDSRKGLPPLSAHSRPRGGAASNAVAHRAQCHVAGAHTSSQ